MGAVYMLTLRQLSGRWRLLIMTVLAALPVLVTLLLVSFDDAPSVVDFERIVLNGILAGSIAPLIVLAIGTVAFGNEIEDRTLANLTLAPIARWQIVLPKLLAAITVGGVFLSASAFATSWIAFLGDARAVAAVTISAIVGVALYASAFTWLGLVSTQAIGIGLLYIVLWEGFISRAVAGVRFFSIRHYATALMHGLDERRFASAEHLSLGIAAAMVAIVFSVFVLLTVRRLRRMDVP